MNEDTETEDIEVLCKWCGEYFIAEERCGNLWVVIECPRCGREQEGEVEVEE